MPRTLMMGKAQEIPDPRAGDICRIVCDDMELGLWVPFMAVGGRSDGDRVRSCQWRFVKYPEALDTETFHLSAVASIEIPCEDERAHEFWAEHVATGELT